MKKTDNRIIKKTNTEKDLFSPDDSIANKEQEILGRPVPGPEPKPKPVPPKPYPPKPDPPRPIPVKDLVFSDGLSVEDDKVIKVKSDKRNMGYMIVSMEGVSIEPLLRKIERMDKLIHVLKERITDAESDINILKGKSKPSSITNIVVGKSKSFEYDDDGKIAIKTDDGIKTNETGHIVVNGNDTLAINEDGQIGVDYDGETLELVGEGDNKKLATVYNSFEMEIQDDNNE